MKKSKGGRGQDPREFYKILGIDRGASTGEVKTAYKKMALVSARRTDAGQKWHPDKNEGEEKATEMFKKISEAYTVLGNQERRSHYDKYGTVMGDNDDDEAFFKEFESMFFGNKGGFKEGSMDDFDMFAEFMAGDDLSEKMFTSMFKDLGANYRPGKGKRRHKKGGGGAPDFDLLTGMFMGMGGMGMPSKPKKTKKKDDSWESCSDEGSKPKKEDDGWETLSEDEVE